MGGTVSAVRYPLSESGQRRPDNGKLASGTERFCAPMRDTIHGLDGCNTAEPGANTLWAGPASACGLEGEFTIR